MYKNLLPLGSVVLLEGGQKRLMIQGRVQFHAGEDIIYDYVGIPWPGGLPNPDSYVFFQKTAIERVYFVGYQDEEEETFREEVLAKMEGVTIENGQVHFPEDLFAAPDAVLLDEEQTGMSGGMGVDILEDIPEESADPALAEALDKAALEAIGNAGGNTDGTGNADIASDTLDL